ncbi:MAG: hypothetical protein Q7N87_00170 [Candidatus Uhrbacteria bacterium]|nr:hypothetical protein [Candidatus Uhrbacteria bacterium]MDP3793542.1 hypothetical protein [Candidatus Uhrbacteria bacterium]
MSAIGKKQESRIRNLEAGSALLFVVVVLMAFLTMTAFLLDRASGLMIRNHLQAMADSGANAGMVALSDLMVEKAEAREPNAPDDTDPRSVLTDEDRQAMLVEGEPRVKQAVTDYVEKNRVLYNITLDSVDIQYPMQQQIDCGSSDKQTANLRVTVKYTHPILFEKILDGKNTLLTAASWQTMNLCR